MLWHINTSYTNPQKHLQRGLSLLESSLQLCGPYTLPGSSVETEVTDSSVRICVKMKMLIPVIVVTL